MFSDAVISYVGKWGNVFLHILCQISPLTQHGLNRISCQIWMQDLFFQMQHTRHRPRELWVDASKHFCVYSRLSLILPHPPPPFHLQLFALCLKAALENPQSFGNGFSGSRGAFSWERISEASLHMQKPSSWSIGRQPLCVFHPALNFKRENDSLIVWLFTWKQVP